VLFSRFFDIKRMINEVRPLLLRDNGGKIRKKSNTLHCLSAQYKVAMPNVNGQTVPWMSPCCASNSRKAFGFGNRSTEAGR
jgi:hypothetical protein